MLLRNSLLMILTLLLSLTVFANTQTMLPSMMEPVTMESSELVKSYSSGVCSIGKNGKGTNCCTGFRIAEDLIMTNFHCLTCVHKIFEALTKNTPVFMEPRSFLYSLPNKDPVFLNLVKDKLQNEAKLEMDYDQFYIPANDQEFKSLMNTHSGLFNQINFNNTIDNDRPLSETTFQIREIQAMNLSLDYAVIRVDGLSKTEKILELNAKKLLPGQPLAIMGHPSVGPYPNKKVYDTSKNCKVVTSGYSGSDTRTSVFTHKCATAPGSSGSPIVNRSNGAVVGIHWGANDSADVRFGIEMKSIIKDLNENW